MRKFIGLFLIMLALTLFAAGCSEYDTITIPLEDGVKIDVDGTAASGDSLWKTELRPVSPITVYRGTISMKIDGKSIEIGKDKIKIINEVNMYLPRIIAESGDAWTIGDDGFEIGSMRVTKDITLEFEQGVLSPGEDGAVFTADGKKYAVTKTENGVMLTTEDDYITVKENYELAHGIVLDARGNIVTKDGMVVPYDDSLLIVTDTGSFKACIDVVTVIENQQQNVPYTISCWENLTLTYITSCRLADGISFDPRTHSLVLPNGTITVTNDQIIIKHSKNFKTVTMENGMIYDLSNAQKLKDGTLVIGEKLLESKGMVATKMIPELHFTPDGKVYACEYLSVHIPDTPEMYYRIEKSDNAALKKLTLLDHSKVYEGRDYVEVSGEITRLEDGAVLETFSYEYDEAGNLIRYVQNFNGTAVGKDVEEYLDNGKVTKSYRYWADGRLVFETTYVKFDFPVKAGVYQEIIRYDGGDEGTFYRRFDPTGKLVYKKQTGVDGVIIAEVKGNVEIRYDDDGKTDSVVTYHPNGKKETITYDDIGEYTVSIEVDGLWVEFGKYSSSGRMQYNKITEYDANGRRLITTEIYESPDYHKPYKTVTTYQRGGGTIAEVISYHRNGNVQSHKKYDLDGRPVFEEEYDVAGKMTSGVVYRYDVDGWRRIVKEYDKKTAKEDYYDKNDHRVYSVYYKDGVVREEYTFDEQGRQINFKEYDRNGVLSETTKTEYDVDGWAKVVTVWDGESGNTTVKKYDERQNLKEVTRYDSNGNKL